MGSSRRGGGQEVPEVMKLLKTVAGYLLTEEDCTEQKTHNDHKYMKERSPGTSCRPRAGWTDVLRRPWLALLYGLINEANEEAGKGLED